MCTVRSGWLRVLHGSMETPLGLILPILSLNKLPFLPDSEKINFSPIQPTAPSSHLSRHFCFKI